MDILERMPLYALRAYAEIVEEEDFTIIKSSYRKYTLDCKGLSGDYATRRLKLLSMELEHPLYMLKERITTVPQLVLTKRTKFIDRDGNVVRYRKSRFLRVEYTKVLRCDRTWAGNYRLVTTLPTVFLSDTPADYIGYIRDGHSLTLYEKCNERKRTRKVKI